MLEFDRILWTDSPTIAAPGAPRHVMQEFPLFPFIPVAQSGGRAILHTGQTPIAFIIHLKERHGLYREAS